MRTKFDYGTAIYASVKTNVLDKLSPTQNTPIQLDTGVFRTSPIISLLRNPQDPLNPGQKYLVANLWTFTKSLPNLPARTDAQESYLSVDYQFTQHFGNTPLFLNLVDPLILFHPLAALFP